MTGSGKTLAFVVPIIEIILRDKPASKHHLGGIILSPTRELALQTASVMEQFSKPLNIPMLLLTGGSDPEDDVKAFKTDGANIIVATPGRLEDMFRRIPGLTGYTKDLGIIVLDEADRLLDLGFERSINSILGRLPKQRRTGLFSATQTQQVQALARAGLRNPIKVAVKVQAKSKALQSTPTSLEINYLIAEPAEKLGMLAAFLSETNKATPAKFMVYMLTCACVDYFHKVLEMLVPDIPVLSLHGKVPAKNRTQVFNRYVTT